MPLIAKIPQKYNKIENEELFNLVEHLTKKNLMKLTNLSEFY